MLVPSVNRSSMPSGTGRPFAAVGLPGLTLLEMTTVIMVLLSLIFILFFSAQAWKRGSDRAMCILNMQNVQKGIRSYANFYNLDPGDGVTGLKAQIIGTGMFVEVPPKCPGSGTYTYGQALGEDVIPAMGSLYLECSLAPAPHQHLPNLTPDW